jgi:hypothetical protein
VKTLEEITYDAGRHVVFAGFAYQRLRAENSAQLRWMSALSALLSVLMVVQTLAWIIGLID